MKLFFDTETTGKADFKAPPCAPHQARIVQLAAVLTDADGKEFGSFACLIKPDGWIIMPDAFEIHGITLEMCEQFGLPIHIALAMLSNYAKRADEWIAFNIAFDRFMVFEELKRIKKYPSIGDAMTHTCEMHNMTPHCRLPKTFKGGGEFKWPSLTEAHITATGADFTDKHDALGDVRAMMRVHFWRLAAERSRETGLNEE